ncbi:MULTISPECIES: DotG/IcmE/VirB10 family protein [Pseudomonas]|uniref:Intracellular multiplication protein IcmE n=1 Tax=Pseudomonas hunanensis TaxID=1247546 RepID=A0ACC6K0Z0_9PSED|nr:MULTISPECIES: DotG/IcmE/VirB10 family protein [Pseudomonas]MBP2260255.1 intracellular multiplication protein IcmE [Pseudomonas sp. BP8]MDR6712107.1 intracellular multiplication protein IcmE [Pseudomonas hunanensis]HDS1733939.1 DotG/IcmE/VirB10 family protein [Pseudomonas putida]
MSENNTPSSDAGFDEEHESLVADRDESSDGQTNKTRKSHEMQRNLQAVFGSGVGKVSLIAAGVVVVALGAMAYNGMTSKDEPVGKTAQVDVPRAPQPEVSVDPISAAEAERRNQRSSLEAQQAAERGMSYQPGFDPNIVVSTGRDHALDETVQFNVPGQPYNTASQQPPIYVGAGQPPRDAAAGTQGARQQGGAANAQADEQERRRLEEELKKAQQERDAYVTELKSETLKSIKQLMGESESAKGFAEKSSFSTVSYYPAERSVANDSGGAARTAKTEKDRNGIEAVGDTDRAMLIKTGTIMYATLDAEVNTDDGGDVLATIRGGKWNGSKLIGKIEQAPDNIRVKFTILAPPVNDTRPTMRISAVALREDDAKQGIAETKDHHTMERYFALGAASLLSGYGRAYQQTAGTTVISPSGVVAQTTTEPSSKQVIGMSVGEMGTSIASEVRRGFNRPATYATPANKGFGLFFLQDVHDQSR